MHRTTFIAATLLFFAAAAAAIMRSYAFADAFFSAYYADAAAALYFRCYFTVAAFTML